MQLSSLNRLLHCTASRHHNTVLGACNHSASTWAPGWRATIDRHASCARIGMMIHPQFVVAVQCLSAPPCMCMCMCVLCSASTLTGRCLSAIKKGGAAEAASAATALGEHTSSTAGCSSCGSARQQAAPVQEQLGAAAEHMHKQLMDQSLSSRWPNWMLVGASHPCPACQQWWLQ
jgi:hypothetical protein